MRQTLSGMACAILFLGGLWAGSPAAAGESEADPGCVSVCKGVVRLCLTNSFQERRSCTEACRLTSPQGVCREACRSLHGPERGECLRACGETDVGDNRGSCMRGCARGPDTMRETCRANWRDCHSECAGNPDPCKGACRDTAATCFTTQKTKARDCRDKCRMEAEAAKEACENDPNAEACEENVGAARGECLGMCGGDQSNHLSDCGSALGACMADCGGDEEGAGSE